MSSEKTEKYGLIGHPVNRSLSPAIQNAAFLNEKINAKYLAYDVLPEELEPFLQKALEEKICGFNVTMPHKETVMKFVKCDEESRRIGAVNTLLLKDEKYFGYNTDSAGFLDSLKSHVNEISGKKILIAGAGGASKAVLYSLLNENAEVCLVNRTQEKGQNIITEINKEIDKEINYKNKGENKNKTNMSRYSFKEINELPFKFLKEFDIFVNTTSLGMNKTDISVWVFLLKNALKTEKMKLDEILDELLNSEKTLFDIVYSNDITPFLNEGKKRNTICIDGKEMLLNQGAKSFEIWTGLKPDIEKMKEPLDL